jgi:hypothetical protein
MLGKAPVNALRGASLRVENGAGMSHMSGKCALAEFKCAINSFNRFTIIYLNHEFAFE